MKSSEAKVLSRGTKNDTAKIPAAGAPAVIDITPEKKKKKEFKLSLRERRLIKNLQNPTCKSLSEAMRNAGYAESTIRDHPGRIVGNSRVNEAIKDIMDRQGITDDRLVTVLSEGLQAKKVISAMVMKSSPNGIADEEDGMKDADGLTKDFVEVDDFMARHKYLETGLKLRGHLQKEGKLDVNLTVETYEQRRKRLGLDDMSPKEALAKYLRENPEIPDEPEEAGS